MFVSKLDSILAKEIGTKTDQRSHIGKIVSVQPITEPEIYDKMIKHTAEEGKLLIGVRYLQEENVF